MPLLVLAQGSLKQSISHNKEYLSVSIKLFRTSAGLATLVSSRVIDSGVEIEFGVLGAEDAAERVGFDSGLRITARSGIGSEQSDPADVNMIFER